LTKLNWAVETFATLASAPDAYAEEENDRPLAAEQEALKTEGRALSKALRSRRSKRAPKTGKALARRHRRVASRQTATTQSPRALCAPTS
jgi:putative transposase